MIENMNNLPTGFVFSAKALGSLYKSNDGNGDSDSYRIQAAQYSHTYDSTDRIEDSS